MSKQAKGKLTSLKQLKVAYLQQMFPQAGEKVPRVRFDGFTGDWKVRKLGDIGKTQSGIGFPEVEQGGKEGVPFFKVSDMNNSGNENEMVYANNYVTQEQITDKRWKPIDDVPAVIFAKVGAAIMLNRKRLVKVPFLIDNNTMAYLFDTSWDASYGKTLFDTLNLPQYAQIGALPSYNGSDIESIEVWVPDKAEQAAIGSFFRALDSIIAYNQRKVTSLKQLKSAYLQQMFPQAGEKAPRVRFSGFLEDWEVKHLGELVTQVVREVPKPDKPYKRLSIRSHAKGTFHQFVEEPEKVAMDKLYIVYENDLIVNITFAWEHAIAVASEEDSGLLVSHRFPTFEISEADVDFIRILITQEEFRKKMELISPGGAGRNRVLSKRDFVKIPLVVPSINEQIAIGTFFHTFDKLIESHS